VVILIEQLREESGWDMDILLFKSSSNNFTSSYLIPEKAFENY
jgi:hypothetical protein